MFRQAITRLVVGVALMAASLAWSGWVFLHSVGDPHRAERIATSILDSPDARREIAGPIADQLIEQVGADPATRATIADAVASVLDDPTVIENFIAAFGSAQANALGVDDPRPTTIDVGALTSAVRERLLTTAPEIADQIPTTAQTIDLPVVKTGAVKSLRTLAQRWTMILALVAFALLVLMMIVGQRRTVLRSYGFWAILSGAFWAIGPRLAPSLAQQAAPNADGIVRATVDAVAGPITAAATALIVSGVVALVVRYAILGADPMVGFIQPHYGDTATAAVPVQQGAYQQPTSQQPAYQQPAYQQPTYQQPTYQQPTYQQPEYQPTAWAQQPPAPDYHPTAWGQQPPAPAGPPRRSTPIDEILAGESPVPGTTPIPLVIKPLDLPSSHDMLSPLSRPDDPNP